MTAKKTGDDIDAQCSRCQMELAHVIVAMVHGRVARVQCKTCRTEHGMRAPKKATTRSEGGKRAARAAGATRMQYEDLMASRDISRAQPYRPATVYKQGDVINHGTFGIGLVAKIMEDTKIEVVFPAGTKVLVHGRC